MKFNDILQGEGVDAHDVSVILHLTNLKPFRAMLPMIVGAHPALFDAYQSVHSRQAAATLRNRPYAASFVPFDDRLIFAGLFRVVVEGDFPVEVIYADPRFAELEQRYGATDTGPARNLARGGLQTRFRLVPDTALSDMIGRVFIDRPLGRTYVRLAANLDATVQSVAETNLLRRTALDRT